MQPQEGRKIDLKPLDINFEVLEDSTEYRDVLLAREKTTQHMITRVLMSSEDILKLETAGYKSQNIRRITMAACIIAFFVCVATANIMMKGS
jgi:hypothetical protein